MRRLLGLCAVLVLASTAGADTLYPEADSEIRDGSYADTNYGTALTAYVREQSGAGTKNRAVFRFDLSSISGTVTDASLRLYVHAAPASTVTHRLYFMSDDTWVETTITWNNCPSTSSTSTTWSVTSSDGGTWKEIDVTDLVEQELAGNEKLSVLAQADTVVNVLPQYRNRDYSGTDYDPQLVVTVSSNAPPEADAGEDDLVTDQDTSGSETVTLDGSGSSDSDGSIVSWVWKEGQTQIATGSTAQVSLSVGEHTITLVVTDDDDATDDDTVVVTVNDPPTADAGEDDEVTDTDQSGSETVTLNGSGSSDSDGTISSWVWKEGQTQIATGSTAQVSLAVGEHTITLTVTDDDGGTDSDQVVMTVNSGGGSETTLYPQADSEVRNGSYADTNYGTALTSYVREQSGSGTCNRAVFRFDLSSISGTVTDASLRLYVHAAPASTVTHRLYFMSDDTWVETTITWNNCPSTSSTSTTWSVTSSDGGTWKEIDVADLVEQELAGNEKLSVLAQADTLVNVLPQYRNRDYSGTDYDPQLVVTTGGGGNQPPVADAGDDDEVTDTDENGSETVTLDGSGSSDSDGTITSWVWKEGETQIATGETVQVSLSVGVHTITLIVTDDDNDTDDDTVIMTVNSGGTSESTLYATADTEVRNASPDTNYGTATALYVREQSGVGTDNRAVFKFDLSSLSGTITDAELRLYVHAVGGSDTSDRLWFMSNDSWVESTITWNNCPSCSSTSTTWQVYTSDANTWKGIDVTELVQQEAAGDDALSVLAMADVEQNVSTQYRSKEYSGTDYDPRLVVTIGGNQRPVADAGDDDLVYDENENGSETVTLDGSGSSDPDGTIASYVWKEGTTQLATDSTASVSLAVGTHTISLTVTDNNGKTDDDTVVIQVKTYELPVADAGEDQIVVDQDESGSETVTLDGSGSSAEDTTIVSWVWKEGTSQIATGETTQVSLSLGTHTVTLIVTDDRDATDDDTVQVTVNEPGVPPTADAGEPWTFSDGDGDGYAVVRLYGDQSTADTSVNPNNTIVSYVWKLGTTQIATGQVGVTSLEPDTYEVTLVVTDAEQMTASDTVTITVLQNQPPEVNAGMDQTVVDEDESGSESVRLYGTGSHDDGGIESYVWKEGETQIATGQTAEVELAVGSHTITLVVTEDIGDRTDSDTVMVYVVDPLVPDYYVDATSGSDSNSGTSLGSAFATIQKAADTVSAGDTVLIKGGTYREQVTVSAAGTAAARITFMGAPGERVLITGCDPVTGWDQCTEEEAGGNPDYANIYSAEFSVNQIQTVFVDAIKQKLARWPNGEKEMYGITSADTTHITDTVHLTQASGFWEGATLYVRVEAEGGRQYARKITSYNPSTHTLTLESALPAAPDLDKDRYYITNSVVLINEPGEYAFDLSSSPKILYLWPSTEDDPGERTVEIPVRGWNDPIVNWTGSAAYLTFDNLEGAYSPRGGFGDGGDGGHDILIKNCIAHHSTDDSKGGFSFMHKCQNVMVRNCLSIQNCYGVVIGYQNGLSNYDYTENFVVDEIQIIGSRIDGVQVGNWVKNVTFARALIKDHWLANHPDGFQTFFGVWQLLFDDVLILNSGQNYATGMVYGGRNHNCMMALAHVNQSYASSKTYYHDDGSGGRRFLPPGEDYDVRHCTYFGTPGGGTLLTWDTRFFYNVIVRTDNLIPFSSWAAYESDYNLVWAGSADTEAFTWWTSPLVYRDLADYQQVSGQDANSVYSAPQFVNAPTGAYRTGDPERCPYYYPELNDNTASKLWLNYMAGDEFEEGDYIEINGDGVLRAVTDAGDGYLTDDNWIEFWPPLPEKPQSPDFVVANWKDNDDFTLDLRLTSSSPGYQMCPDNSDAGSTIDIQDYLAGDFDGDQVRDVPDWPILSPTVRAELDYGWVYQNDTTITGDGHLCVLTIKVDDPNGNSVYDVTVTVNQSSTGEVVVEPTGNPLVWHILGGEHGVDPTGAVTLDIDLVGLDRGGEDDTTAQLEVRPLGDINDDGSVDSTDDGLMDSWLANPPVQGYEVRHFDLDADDDVDTTDEAILDSL